jgi:hypothetical protein
MVVFSKPISKQQDVNKWAMIAGFFCGDGSLCFRDSYAPYLLFCQSNKAAESSLSVPKILRIIKRYTGGTIRCWVDAETAEELGRSPAYVLQLTQAETVVAMRKMLPYLGVMR